MAERISRISDRMKAALIVLSILLFLVIGTIAGAVIYVNHLLGRMNHIAPGSEDTIPAGEAQEFLYNDPELSEAAPGETYPGIDELLLPDKDAPSATEPASDETEIPQPTTPPVDLSGVYGDHLVNILLVGQDRRSWQGRQRSDAMILVSLNKSRYTVTLTSFMRDQYVQIPGYSPNKLNTAYALGGMSLLSETLELNFGVKLDGIVEVDFGSFETVIDRLGGVDLHLTQAEADYFAECGLKVHAGANHFNGRKALFYAQVRELDSDYARTNRQRKLIAALIQSYKNLPLDQMLSTMNSILPLITTNMTNSQIIDHALDMFPMLASAEIQTGRIPVDGTYDSGLVEVRKGFTGWFIYNIDFNANKQALADIFCK